ncbi:MAG: hypothetical protein EOO77_11575, partial [Oxalobacteraceae bacterium]
MTEEEIKAWTAKQNAMNAPNAPSALPVISAGIAPEAPFEPIQDIAAWMAAQAPEEPVVVLTSLGELIAHIRTWVETITVRPAVLCFAEFNMWAQLNLDLLFTQHDALAAWEAVMEADYPYRFHAKRVIRGPEWTAFFQKYGAVGIVAGAIDPKTIEALNNPNTYPYV